MILLDWTRMGRSYCLAGAVAEGGGYRIVRPLLTKHREAPVRNVGWSAYLLDRHSRWEVFELVDPRPADLEPPHAEDVWVRSLRPRRCLAAPDQRRHILTATLTKPGEPPFGIPLVPTRTAAYLEPGTGVRSLATILVASQDLRFSVLQREGAAEPDVRVMLPLPGLAERIVSVKDHHLLRRAQSATGDPDGQASEMQRAVRQMGNLVAVRLGLSRAFQGTAGSPRCCWVMADGFFSMCDPQP